MTRPAPIFLASCAGFALLCGAAAFLTAARGGHELPVYPSFYPHEIELRVLAPDQAPEALRRGKVQAYLGPGLDLAGTPPAGLRTIESLGAFVVVRVNRERARTPEQACAAARGVVRALAGSSDFIPHPYPVTPLHGDYLHHADLAAAAKARYLEGGTEARDLRIRSSARFARSRPDWSSNDPGWDAEIVEVDAAGLVAAATYSVNGRPAPPWVKAGWFHAERLLADAAHDPAARERVADGRRRLETGAFAGLAEQVNLERDLVTALTGTCWKLVAGYTAKHEYINVDFSAGIENVGFDAITGLNSPIFVRTVKLKDFPWNGWLALGIEAAPASAWNPVGGMTDPFGRFVGFTVGDPALFPQPYGPGWMLNRIADVTSNPGQ